MLLFVVFLALLSTTQPQPCDEVCQQSQREALAGLYSSLDGPHWLRNSGWTDTAEHCTWDGVECCNQTAGSIGVLCATPGAVAALDLSVNNATGTWPASGLRALAASLTSLSLRGNNIQGSLPESIGTLQRLSVLSIDDNSLTGSLPASLGQLQNLTQLTAAANKFSGVIPSSLSRLQQLQWLLLSDNQLTGLLPAGLFALPQLQLLALQGNMLQGPLPTTAVAQQSTSVQGPDLMASVTGPLKLVEVRLSHNQLTGSITTFVAQLPTLLLDISHNRLTGSLPDAFSTNKVLRELYLSHNQLSGTLSPDLLSAHLQVLDLSSNKLTGSIPTLATTSYYIETLNLSNNSFTGVVPADIGRLVNLQQIDWSANHLTPQDRLPGSLVLDSSQPPVSADPADLALQCQPVVAARNPTAQVTLDPSSYGYEGCSCKDPFAAVVGKAPDGAVTMKCIVQQQQQDNKTLAHVLGPLLAVLGVALIALVAVAAAWRWGLTGFVQRFSDQAEKKVPPGGTAKDVTLVLTDVQGSTELWEWDQQLAAEAFKLHDRILRQYMTLFYGYEVSTEGDAFLIAFHEPFDATAWCLCVQLALHYADWPTPLLQHKSTCLDTEETLEHKRRQRHGKWHSQQSVGHETGAGVLTAEEAADSGPWSGATDTLMAPPVAAADDIYDTSGATNAMDPGMTTRAGKAFSTTGNKVVGSGILFRGLRVRMSIATGGVESVRLHSVTQRAEYVGEVLRKVQAVGETPQGGQIIMDSETFRGVHSRLPELGGVVLEATQKLLRNRAMPSAQELASMFSCPPGTDMAQSRDPGWLMHNLDGMSAQRLPNAHNITSYRDSLELNAAGPVDQHGSARQQTSAVRSSSTFTGAGGSGGRRRPPLLDTYSHTEGDIEEGGGTAVSDPCRDQAGFLHQAAVLCGLQDDSDESNHQGTNDCMATFTAERTTVASPRSTLTQLKGLGRLGKRQRKQKAAANGLKTDRRRSSLSYGIMVIDMGVHQLTELAQKIDLVQVMPCGLEDRARFFPRLDSLRQDTPGYFDAPAAGLVPLSPSGDLKGVTIPPVTIVFCTIDKYCDLVEANRSAAELALELYSDCVRWLLLVGAGYECQESEGTFMVAFSSPDVAIEWCLMVQQVLKDMSWPASVLDLPTCEEERDMHGNIMFRGPRVKMGVYSGTPTRVMPHTTTGRADYFGPLVNRAARYCHAAARGGQVLVPKELMCEVIGKWVDIDSIELMQCDRLLDFVAFFDEERRLWPWMFKRRSHWDMPMSALYPSIPPPPPGMGPSWQQAAAAAAATPHVPAGVAGGLSRMQMPAAADGVDYGVAADFTSPEAAAAAGNAADQPDAAGSGAPEMCMLNSSSLERIRNVDRRGLGADLATLCAGLDEAELMASVNQGPGGPGDTVPLGRLAPLHESAEGSTGDSPSEGGNSHPHVKSSRSQSSVPASLMQRRPRRYSDVSQQYNRLGPQHLQALQMQYNQGLPAAAAHQHPYGFLQNQNAQQQYKRSFQGNAPGPMLTPPLWAGLDQQGLLASRYRRPSYLSDVSSRYRRHSNTSDVSGLCSLPGSMNSVAWATWVLAQPQQQEASSRRPSALSEFFTGGPQSRRSSNVSTDRQGSWPPMDPASGSGRASDRSRLAPAPAVGTAATATAAAGGVPQPAAAQQQHRMQQQAQQLHQQLQWYQRQQTEQQLKQQMMQGARAGFGASVGQAVGSDMVPTSDRSHRPGAAAATGAAAAASGAVVRPQSSGSRQSGPVAAAHAQQQQPGHSAFNSPTEAATNPVSGSNAVAVTAAQSRSAAAAGARAPAAAGTTQPLLPGRQQQQGTGSLVGHRSPPLPHSSSTGNSITRDTASVSRQPSHTSQPAVPAALLMQGLESQVLPGMLHSSSRLRLVSKRRRQMSYVFSQESSNPGVPADGADPKRLVGYSSGYGVPLAPHASTGTPPTSDGIPSEGSAGMMAAGLRFMGSNAGSSKFSGGNSATASRRDSSRTSASGESLHRQSFCGQQQQHLLDMTDPATGASVIDSSSRLPGMAEAENEGSRATATPPVPPDPAAAAAATAAQNLFWNATVMGDYCGLPEIEPLPDADVLQSLRLAARSRTQRPSNVSTLTDSMAGFGGRSIGDMCADIMRGRWLWIGELLVHDLGQFRFKGVAGVHSIVSVTSEELGGRTFPTTIRRGKGEQIRLGRGLLANVQMRARARQPGWGPYAGQQLLQNPAPQPPGDSQQGQPPMPAGVSICHACSGIGLQTSGSVAAASAGEAAAAGVPPPETEQLASGLAASTAAGIALSAAGGGGGAMIGSPGLQYVEQQPHHSAALHGTPAAGGLPATAGLTASGNPMLKVGSLSDIRALSASSRSSTPVEPLSHVMSAPESATAAAAAAALSAKGSSSNHFGGYPCNNPVFYPVQLPAERVRQHWQTQLLQQHYWQQQQLMQQQRLQRRRHSVCVGTVHRRTPTRPYGARAEMYPFQESAEQLVKAPNSAAAAAASGSNVGSDQQQQVQQQQVNGRMGAARGADAAMSASSAAVVVLAGGHGVADGRTSPDPFAECNRSTISNNASNHASDTFASINDCVSAAAHGAGSFPDLNVLPADPETDNAASFDFGAKTGVAPGDTRWGQNPA